MKKMYKRILALVLVLALTFSCTAFASAAEVTAEAPDFVSEQSGGDEGIMPFASGQLTPVREVRQDDVEGSFYLSSSSYLWMISSMDNFTVLRLYYGRVSDDHCVVIKDIQAGGQKTKLSDTKFGAGTYYYKLTAGYATGAFALAATDTPTYT